MANLAKLSWQLNSVGYARRTVKANKNGKIVFKTLLMHRHIAGAEDGMVVDHINGNKLDNRLNNLRVCTQSENLGNRLSKKSGATSKYHNVHKNIERRWKTNRVRWDAAIAINGKHYRKSFKEEEQAAHYIDCIVKTTGDKFHKLNFPDENV